MSRNVSIGPAGTCRAVGPAGAIRASVPVLLALLLAAAALPAAGQTPPAPPKTDTSAAGGGQSPPAPTAAGVMQIKKGLTGDFSYRFVGAAGKSSAETAPVPLPTPPAADNIVAIPIPSTADVKAGSLEILDNGRGNIARLPIKDKGVVDLTESSFTLAQRVNVPVQSKSLGVIGAQVTMSDAARKYSQSRLLQPDDNGIARFDAVPLNVPLTVTVSYGSNPPESQTRTLTAARTPDAWPPIAVTWPDAKTVTPPAAPPAAAPGSAGAATRDADRGRGDDASRGSRSQEANPVSSLVSTIISLAFLAAVAYGIFWAYQTGRLKQLFDHLGIQQQPSGVAAGIPDPFAKQNRTPIQPITEGTADPFAGGAAMSVAAAPAVADGPRLVATAGAYAGSIFPIGGPSADIGRDQGNAVALPNDTNASRRHATIQAAGGQYTLVDNGSSNGTFINGVRIASQTPQAIRPGDEVQIGLTRFRFEA
ncbi:MAG TPA: FHA domain-containing protein [Chthonomonadaceae bacterium]|nr:FHA domain-containing protein [Chthonomonadaceae bacterium]